MGTFTKPVIHYFEEVSVGKFRSVRHYKLSGIMNGVSLLSNAINISKDQNFSKAAPDYWLKTRLGNKWGSCVTGLFKTGFKNIYKGDIDNKKHLVIFKFSEDGKVLTVFYFENYYTSDLSNILQFVNSYQ